jgi:hypothetical protein
MEVTKWLKPSECVSRIGDSASVQARFGSGRDRSHRRLDADDVHDPCQIIAVNVKLEENRWLVRRPTSRRRLNPLKPHLGQIERIDKHIDHANRVTIVNEIIEAFGQ